MKVSSDRYGAGCTLSAIAICQHGAPVPSGRVQLAYLSLALPDEIYVDVVVVANSIVPVRERDVLF